MSFDPKKLYAACADPSNALVSDADLAGILNVTTRQGIDLAALGAYLSAQGLKLSLKAAASNAQLPSQLTAALATFLDYLDDLRHTSLDYADATVGPQVDATLGGCVQATLMTQTQADAITAMGLVYPTGGPVQPSDVTAARATLALDQQATTLGNKITTAQLAMQGQVDAWRRANAFPGNALAQLAALFPTS